MSWAPPCAVGGLVGLLVGLLIIFFRSWRHRRRLPAPAKGRALDAFGAMFGVERRPKERDRAYRRRLVAAADGWRSNHGRR
jgi:hypothetical protein